MATGARKQFSGLLFRGFRSDMIDNERLEGGPSTKKVMDRRRRRTKREMTKGGKRTEVNYVSEKVKGAEKKDTRIERGTFEGDTTQVKVK